MIQDRICEQCGISFKGGPRAYYCPSCRIERSKQTNRDYKQRKKIGKTRELGSIDICEKCNEEYVVNSGLQRFCSKCQIPHNLEYDRETGLEFYHKNKDTINPIRNERRRIGLVLCKWCGIEFDAHGTRRLYCSKSCKQKAFNKYWMIKYYHKRLKRKKPVEH